MACRAAGITEPVIENRLGHWRKLATVLDIGFRELTNERVMVVAMGYANKTTRSNFVSSIRVLTRWAAEAGLLAEDPMTETFRCQRVPATPEWAREHDLFIRHLRGSGKESSTVTARSRAIVSLSRDFAGLSPADITLDDLMDRVATKGWSRGRMRAERVVCRQLWAFMKDRGLVKKDVTKKWPIIRAEDGKPQPASDDDLTIAMGLADADEKLMLRIMAELGLRCAEVASIHANDLTVRDGLYSLRVNGKGAKVRIMPVTEDLARAIHSRGAGFVFRGQANGHISAAYVSKKISRLLPPGVTAHKLRHKFGTDTYAATKDTFATQRLMGHASADTTSRFYVEVGDDTLRAAVEAVSARRGGIDRAREQARV
ncbi:tyrosine-type recombinase/integrase [Microbacterium sp. Leaf179]|uniref:tyrosine-type recombinase/integrase n=1 Tax=Microbacterium sp. Leaf179 TaxID=1736288 RepID=UPI000AE5EC1D|nr:tyrosine-type recombinase/integrase [Microbacterium sp. Leaf179]